MVTFKRKRLAIDIELRKKLDIICQFAKVKPRYINGNIISIDHTNLEYIETHKIFIKDHMFSFFNFSKEIYDGNLGNKNNIKEFESYLKKHLFF